MTNDAPEHLHRGDDDKLRCAWGASTPDYREYHDLEWGRPVTAERTLFEKLCLEGFQSGLSWLTILRKREGFRVAFANFDADTVAGFGEADVLRLLDDTGIVRHRGKIEASITNARAVVELHSRGDSLAELFWAHRPTVERIPTSFGDVPAKTVESAALANELKQRGFTFVGPTTAYAAMQAMGVVNDHLAQCWVRDACEAARPTRL
ncbi:MAG: DNA-3-methyladenine glycosylase I [Actinomycetota bacterium]|nr:DNA-3-methyladenine glycosylase I [Actinomycetota bacterium]